MVKTKMWETKVVLQAGAARKRADQRYAHLVGVIKVPGPV